MPINYKFVGLIVVLLATQVESQELNSTLYSTISGVPVAFVDETVVFTCMTTGSNHMGWSSEQYIGTGGRRLEFISANPVGSTNSLGQAEATLISLSDGVIVSQLQITVRSTFPNASVQCQNIGADRMTSITFRLAENDTSVVCDRQSVCPGGTVRCVCATGNSNTLAWSTNRNRLVLTPDDPPLTRLDVSASAVLTDRSNRSGVVVITSNLTVAASMSDTSLLAMCENVDRSTLNAVSIPVSETCPDPPVQVTTPAVTEAASTGSCAGPIAAAIVVPIIFALAAVVIVVIVIVVFPNKYYKHKYKALYDEDEKTLKEEYAGKETTLEESYNKKKAGLDEKEAALKKEEKTLKREYAGKESALIEREEALKQECANQIDELSDEKFKAENQFTAKIHELENEIKTLKETKKANETPGAFGVNHDPSQPGAFGGAPHHSQQRHFGGNPRPPSPSRSHPASKSITHGPGTRSQGRGRGAPPPTLYPGEK